MSTSGEEDFPAYDPDSTDAPLMTWSIKVQTRPTRAWDIAMALLMLLGIIALTNGLYEDLFSSLGRKEKSVLLNSGFGLASLLITAYLWVMVVRRKTAFHYSIHPSNGLRLQHLAVPEHAGLILNLLRSGVPLFSLILIVGNPSLAWLLALPVVVSLVGPHAWLGLDLDMHSEISVPWSFCQRVLIDRQNNRVVACQADRNDGFEVYLPDNLLDSYLTTLGSLLPANALFVQSP